MAKFFSILIFHLAAKSCLAGLTVVSPDEIRQDITDYVTSSFGSPSYYPIFGKLVPITTTTCSLSMPLDSFSIGLVYLNPNISCSYSSLAFSLQNSGAIGIIFVLDEENTITPANDAEGAAVQILVLGISSSLGEVLSSNSDKQIWVTYSYGIIPSGNPVIEYFLTSNYSLDQQFFTALEKLNNDISLSRFELQIGFVNEIYSLANSSTDCIDSYYCVPSSGAVTGAQKLSNSLVILNYYNMLQDDNSVTDIITLVLDLYSICQNDYSTQCLYSVSLLSFQQIPSNP